MDMNRLTEIKKRIAAIGIESKWGAVHSASNNQSYVEADSYIVGIEMAEEDAEFIAHAKQDVPDLVAEIERLREALEFYANRETYRTTFTTQNENGTASQLRITTAIRKDLGRKARQALRTEGANT